jgi:hypothetical protein
MSHSSGEWLDPEVFETNGEIGLVRDDLRDSSYPDPCTKTGSREDLPRFGSVP